MVRRCVCVLASRRTKAQRAQFLLGIHYLLRGVWQRFCRYRGELHRRVVVMVHLVLARTNLLRHITQNLV